jgi:hypothetical protein
MIKANPNWYNKTYDLQLDGPRAPILENMSARRAQSCSHRIMTPFGFPTGGGAASIRTNPCILDTRADDLGRASGDDPRRTIRHNSSSIEQSIIIVLGLAAATAGKGRRHDDDDDHDSFGAWWWRRPLFHLAAMVVVPVPTTLFAAANQVGGRSSSRLVDLYRSERLPILRLECQRQ